MKRHTLSVSFLLAVTGTLLVTGTPNEDVAVVETVQDDLEVTVTLHDTPCDDEVFCKPGKGSILHTVQLARIFEDSKTFVDMPMKNSPSTVKSSFENMMKETNQNPTKDRVKEFLEGNFDTEGTEFELWTPEDWRENPQFVANIKDENYKEFAKQLHSRWINLGRKIKDDFLKNADRSSLLYMPHPFIVPGGRFREMYYWDSYWTIKGLLLSEMNDTVKGMLDNFKHLVNQYALVPNGNRKYYLRRSQPPLYIPMVELYLNITDDPTTERAFLSDCIFQMKQEFDFWWNNRTTIVNVAGKDHQLARYNVPVDGPRPESYYEDYHDAQSLPQSQRTRWYQHMKSGAESGWDYSSRWFNQHNGTVANVRTGDIIPVDLNAILCKNAAILAGFFRKLERDDLANQYEGYREKIREGIRSVMWNEEDGIWYDWNTVSKSPKKDFYISNIAPLYTGCFTNESMDKVLDYFNKSGALEQPGGIPTSLVKSGQQWDFPNIWAPLVEMLVTSLQNTGKDRGKLMARDVADKFVKNAYQSFVDTEGTMFEKYNCEKVGGAGSGGEYSVQEGFGWTNGVVLSLLDMYGDVLQSTATMCCSVWMGQLLLLLVLSYLV